MSGELGGYILKNDTEELEHGSVTIKVHDGVMELQYDNQVDKPRALKLAKSYLDAYIFRTGQKITVNFNHSWENTGLGVAHALNFEANVHVTERVQVRISRAEITGRARIVTKEFYDSASLSNDTALVNKALNDSTLAKALDYYASDVVDADKPLNGIYNSIEVITKHLGGHDERKQLAMLAGKGESYVGDLMQATQFTRHAVTNASVRLSDEECRQMALVLIRAYADSIVS